MRAYSAVRDISYLLYEYGTIMNISFQKKGLFEIVITVVEIETIQVSSTNVEMTYDYEYDYDCDCFCYYDNGHDHCSENDYCRYYYRFNKDDFSCYYDDDVVGDDGSYCCCVLVDECISSFAE